MTKPQIIMIVLLVIELYATMYRCIKKDGKIGSAMTASFIRVGTLISVLYYGGFWK
jgi:hypothetical protein